MNAPTPRLAALAICAAFLASYVAPTSAAANHLCGDRARLIEGLGRKHSEFLVAEGLDKDGSVLEILASPGGSFTILRTYPKRETCVIAVGNGWQLLKIKAGAPV